MKRIQLRHTLLAATSLSVGLMGMALTEAIAGDVESEMLAQSGVVTLPEVKSYGYTPIPNRIILEPSSDKQYPAADASDVLKLLPGVSAGRMGGHGLEPYIRGQSQGRLNIIDDGAFIHGGCPNRMDPPTAYMTVDSIDTLIVDKGYATVSNGPGGSGGTVTAKRNAPVFDEGKAYQGSVEANVNSNANSRGMSGDVSADTGWGYVRAEASYSDADNYKDGNGRSVRSAYSSHGGRVEVGVTPTDGDEIRLSLQGEKIEDAVFAGAGMDSPLSETLVLRGSLGHDFEDKGVFSRLNVSAYGSLVDHVMDNFSLRDRTGNVMKVNSDSDTFGGKLGLHGQKNDLGYTLGADVQVNKRDAVRFMGTRARVYENEPIQAYSWPDMTLKQIGVYGEIDKTVQENHTLRAGLRYDRVDVSADKADRVASMPAQSANTLYQNYYGVTAEDRSENNISGLLRYEIPVDKNQKVFFGVSRSMRTADVTERGIGHNHNTAASRWVGRPDIKPEAHYQADIGGEASYKDWAINGSVYYDRVEDYILRDLARAQDGILLNDNATVYRNVDATLTGFEMSGSYRIDDQWSLGGQASYTYGKNEEDGRPLAQTPPLEFTTSLEYTVSDWMAGLRLRGAKKQTRADIEAGNNSGQDSGETSGYAVLDAYGEVFAFEPVTISLGVTNILDKVYANHLSRSSAFDTEVTQVNEPGRAFFLRAHATF